MNEWWLEDKMRNQYIRVEVKSISMGVALIKDKIRDNILKWLGHVLMKKKTGSKISKGIHVDSKWLRGRLKKR